MRYSTKIALAGAAFASAALAVPAAQAVPIGPGDTIRNPATMSEMYKDHYAPTGMCSVALTGDVDTGDGSQPVIVTAGHCAGDKGVDVDENAPKNKVVLTDGIYVPTRDGDVRVGDVEHHAAPSDDFNPADPLGLGMFAEDDYTIANATDNAQLVGGVQSTNSDGTVTSEKREVTSIRDYPRLDATQPISFDNLGQPICKDGSRTGRSCGTQLARTNNAVLSLGLDMTPGDSGGLTWDKNTGEAVGINSMVSQTPVGQLGRAQTIDYALENSYGILDGEVNDRFSIAGDTDTPRADLMTIDETTELSTEYQNEQHNGRIADAQEAVDSAFDATDTLSRTWQNDPVGAAQEAHTAYNQSLSDWSGIAQTDPQAALDGAHNSINNHI